jgi:hypothetical protein
MVITNCTNRKRYIGDQPLTSHHLRGVSADQLARDWVQRLTAASRHQPAELFYAGRSFREARLTALSLELPLYVVSAGLGLIRSVDLVPAYDLTVSDEAFANQLSSLRARPSDWWLALCRALAQENISNLVARIVPTCLFVALPASYLRLVKDDLARIPAAQVERLRIFTSPSGFAEIPPHLRIAVLPYDERLEGSSRAGTRSDFPQRAMAHFVLDLNAAAADLYESRKVVQKALGELKVPTLPMRRKQTDQELRELMRSNWQRFGGQSTRLLRFLRDEAKVACEQGRFRSLWLELGEAFKSDEALNA